MRISKRYAKISTDAVAGDSMQIQIVPNPPHPEFKSWEKWSAALLSASLFFPSAMKLLDSPLINGNRLILFFLTITAAWSFLRASGGGERKLVGSDMLVLAFAASLFVSTTMNEGLSKPLASTAIPVLEFGGSYIAVRALVRNQHSFDLLARAYVIGCTVSIVCALIDLASGSVVVNNLFASATGAVPIASSYRFGLLRAASTQEHAILFGCMCALGILFVQAAVFSWQDKLVLTGLMLFGTLLSLSAAPLIAAALILTWCGLQYLVRDAIYRTLLISVMGTIVVAAMLSYGWGFEQLLSMVTFESASGTFRMLIWRYATAEIELSPWIGIGYRDWTRPNDMPESVDSLWLFLGMRYGLVSVGLFFTVMLIALFQRKFADAQVAKSVEWMTVGIWSLAFCGLTVHLWGSTWMMFGVLLGCQVGLGSSMLTSESAQRD